MNNDNNINLTKYNKKYCNLKIKIFKFQFQGNNRRKEMSSKYLALITL